MLLDPVKNFPKVTVSTGYDNDDTSIALTSGHGARLPQPSTDGAFNMVWWNSTDYPDPSDDPNREIIRVTARSTDTLTIVRPVSGNSYNGEDSDNTAKNHNTAGKTYKMAICVTKRTFRDLSRPINSQALRQPITDFNNYILHESLDSGWGDWYGNGTTSHDTGQMKVGAGCIKVVTPGGAELCGMRKNITDVDMSDAAFGVWVRAVDWAKVAEVNLLISTSGTFDSFYAVNLKPFLTSPTNDEWLHVYLTRDKFAGSGTPNWSTVNDMIVRVIDAGTGAATVYVDDFIAFHSSPDHFISVVFDDGWASQYPIGKVKMEQYGMRGTFYIIPELLDGVTFMSEAQLEAAHEVGWEIAGHGQTNLTTLSEDDLKVELQRVRQWLSERGYQGQEHYAYPNGGHNNLVHKIIKRYFSTGRALDWGSIPLEEFNPQALNARSPSNLTTTTSIKGWIDGIMASGGWLIITFHKLVASPVEDTEYLISDFEEVIDYLATQGATVLPVGEVYKRLQNRDYTQA